MGCLPLNGKDCTPQARHNDFECTDAGCPGYFMILTGPQESSIWRLPGSHTFISHPKATNMEIGELLKICGNRDSFVQSLN